MTSNIDVTKFIDYCHSKNIKWYTRIIGYLRAIKNFGYERQIEASKRIYSKMSNNELD